MVYVVGIDGKPLMPCTEAKAGHLLKDKRAKIVHRLPFTVRLLFTTGGATQPVTLGVDAGNVHHLVQCKDGGPDRPDNLVTLCHRTCHDGKIALRAMFPETHGADAFYTAGNLDAKRMDEWLLQKKARCHNRQLPKLTIVKGFRLFDAVSTPFGDGFVFGRRSNGCFDIRALDGTRISKSISWKKIALHQRRTTLLKERRKSVSSPA